MILKFWLVFPALAAGAVACGFLLFCAGAIVAEAALRPRVVPIPRTSPTIAATHCTSVEIRATDGTRLSGWYFRPLLFTGHAVMVLHGIAASREQVVDMARLFLSFGYSVLAPDLRGHGDSGGMVTFGVYEADDVRSWGDWLFESEHVSRLYGLGESLGGATLLQSLRLETRFSAVIAESAYSDFQNIARERIVRSLPVGTKWLARSIVFSGVAWTRWRYGIDLRKTSSPDAVGQTRVPVLLIHGLADNETSPGNSRRIAEANPETQLWLVPQAGHMGARETEQSQFASRVRNWFERH